MKVSEAMNNSKVTQDIETNSQDITTTGKTTFNCDTKNSFDDIESASTTHPGTHRKLEVRYVI
jgi:hypothetical protein